MGSLLPARWLKPLPWAGRLAAPALLGLGLCGCANFWDEVTSRDFEFKSLFVQPDPLVVLRDSHDGDKRAKALRSLREPREHGGTEQDQEMILKLLATAAAGERQALCRLAAIQSLSRFKDPRAVDALTAAYFAADGFRDGGGDKVGYPPETASVIRCQALAALGQTKNPAAVDLLVRVVRQPRNQGPDQDRIESTDERIAAARALGNFSQAQATEALVHVLRTERDVALRDRATESLQVVTGRELPADAKAWEQYLQQAGGPEAAAERGAKFKLAGFFQRSEPSPPAGQPQPTPQGGAGLR